MLTNEQIDNWEHLKLADTIVERVAEQKPITEWFKTENEVHAIVAAYIDMTRLVHQLNQTVQQTATPEPKDEEQQDEEE